MDVRPTQLLVSLTLRAQPENLHFQRTPAGGDAENHAPHYIADLG